MFPGAESRAKFPQGLLCTSHIWKSAVIGLRFLPHDSACSADFLEGRNADEPPKDVCVGGLRPPGCIKVERVGSRRPILKFNIYLTNNWPCGGGIYNIPLRLESQVVN